MEFASRRTTAGARVLAGLLALVAGPACRRSAPSEPAHPAGPTAPLGGRVTDEGSRPVPGARVLALGPEGDARAAEASAAVVTDADGRFRFDALPHGSYALLVEAAGLLPTRVAGVMLPGPEPVVRLAGLGRALEGVVVETGAAVSGARVLLGSDDGAFSRETTTGADGRFIFHGLGGGSFTLRATRGDLASPPVSVGGGAARLELAAGFVVEGVVVDDRGRALAGVDVRVEAAAGDPVAEVARTTGDGHFHAGPLPAGSVRLLARAPGFIARATTTVVLGGAPTPPVRLELSRAATLAGRIVDARGAAVPGAEVRCVATGGGDDLAVIYAPLPLAAEAAALPPSAGRAAAGGTRLVRSDPRGAFRFGDLPPGPFHLEIAHAPAVPLRTGEWVVAAGEGRDVGALVLRDGAVTSGRVLDEGGNPLAGARVLVTPSVGVFAVTDAAGGFSLTLPPGRYTVAASAATFGEARATVDVAAAAPPPLELRLSRADARLEGLARDGGGRPVARAVVRAYAFDPARAADAASPPRGPAIASGGTDAGGHFALPRLPGGPVLVAVDHPDYPVTYALSTPGARLDVTVPIAGGIDGEVRERGTGAVVPRARVDAVGPRGQPPGVVVEPQSRAAGSFRLKRLAPGGWTLTATAPGYRAATRQVDVPPSEILGDASVRGLRLELEPAR